jgi:serine/threonine protein kinase
MHRDLRPSQIFITNDLEPKLYHIGFMQNCECREPVESGCVWAAPEVVCGSAMMVSDVWSIGTICCRLFENLLQMHSELFATGMFKLEEELPDKKMLLQDANNCVVIA